MINKEKFKELFNDKLDKINDPSSDDILNIGYEILMEQLKLKKKKIVQKKKVKVNKRLEKKIVDLIVTYRKTSKEIKNIIKEENSIELSDRDLRKIKEDNFIKGNKIIAPVQQKINIDEKNN